MVPDSSLLGLSARTRPIPQRVTNIPAASALDATYATAFPNATGITYDGSGNVEREAMPRAAGRPLCPCW